MAAPTAPTARARVRAELTQEILDAGKAQLAEHGAAALSLRAVARDVGMVSSAVYRYFPSRDHLLTALIVDAYDGLGATVEDAVRDIRTADFARRWMTMARSIRDWATANPHEYALIYGSPVPGYQAPVTTIGPATRVSLLMIQLLIDAAAAGQLNERELHAPLPRPLRADLVQIRATFGTVSDATIVHALTAWTALFGLVSFELFGQFHNVIAAHDEFFDAAVRELGTFVGLPLAKRP